MKKPANANKNGAHLCVELQTSKYPLGWYGQVSELVGNLKGRFYRLKDQLYKVNKMKYEPN